MLDIIVDEPQDEDLYKPTPIEKKFCLAENELNTSFCNNFMAVLTKRF